MTPRRGRGRNVAARQKPAASAAPEPPAAAAPSAELLPDDDGHLYSMTVDLSVLEALGINLYSNAAAVLSELVANAYDADSTLVAIDWKNHGSKVVVADDGAGMTRQELNDRFLKVGYKKRLTEGLVSPRWERPYMGRKGIGKLSVFSIAETVTVYSTKDQTSNGLQIKVPALEEAIRAGEPYHPLPVNVPKEYARRGTVIVLEDLKHKRADLTATALRKRLARRFDVLHQTPPEEGGFYIAIDAKNITYADRQELKKLEFVWEFGEDRMPGEVLPTGITRFDLPDTVSSSEGWKVRGWIGTARRPTDLTDDEEAGSLKNIIVLARGRPIQEGIIEKLDFSRIFGNYVTGQVEADFLDLDGDYGDIATSDRQRLIEDDERVIALQKFLREAFVKASDQWSEHRPKKEAQDVLGRFPALKDWVEARPTGQQEAAKTMIGTIAALALEKKTEAADRATLFRSGVLAFERIGLRDTAAQLGRLEELGGLQAADLLPLLGSQEAYEAGLWVDILRSRVEAISTFRSITRSDEKEKVVHKHLFDNLWLLDASWERASVGGKMEENLRDIHPGLFARGEQGDEITGRIDIRYATSSGRHVIVELKRSSARPTVTDLQTQGLKYFNALDSILEQRQRPDRDIEVIFVLGTPPRTPTKTSRQTADEHIHDMLKGMNGRYVLYEALINNAEHQYQEYLEASDKARDLDKLMASLDQAESE
ncbi:BbrUII/HgiDII family restriction enzyme [Klenkia taihuensis]|uniref:Histidine kinase-, DNA gyrase B-, and HSP90-like ATPase n=1 Tax=Klenkia taihuensis TaxID=1225127 RepID=A0A1I1IC52_9ACTN|nr:ATP-binding protein [Klenkia taihuensis]GHE08701.1 hypothetical protein GCM10011381_10200 [Klenkia taihuensis]SFC33857.1 Histidine kinase-, DNA gyrase B-, and HSP90-like ATPase [Klenkia taihuensis]